MLTVDYRRLGVQPGDRLLDLGCGAGRHAYEALRLGALVTALDSDGAEVKDVAVLLAAMEDEGEAGEQGGGTAVQGNALSLPFADGTFDRVIAAEVLEHIPPDRAAMTELARVLAPGGTMAVTVPRWYPELINWALSDAYHSVEGGHVRIYRRSALEQRLSATGLRVTGHHHAHSLHSAYWWLKCAVGVDNDTHPLVQGYHRFLCWDIEHRPLVTQVADRLLNPVLGKSLVVYLEKPC
jgi:SAM-dependent methyltransferase